MRARHVQSLLLLRDIMLILHAMPGRGFLGVFSALVDACMMLMRRFGRGVAALLVKIFDVEQGLSDLCYGKCMKWRGPVLEKLCL